MSGLNSKYPLAIVADAPKDLLKLQGALAQPNHSRGRGPEHGNYRGVSASEQPQLGRAVRRAKCEWAWEGGGVEVIRGGPDLPICLPRATSATALQSTRPASSV